MEGPGWRKQREEEETDQFLTFLLFSEWDRAQLLVMSKTSGQANEILVKSKESLALMPLSLWGDVESLNINFKCIPGTDSCVCYLGSGQNFSTTPWMDCLVLWCFDAVYQLKYPFNLMDLALLWVDFFVGMSMHWSNFLSPCTNTSALVSANPDPIWYQHLCNALYSFRFLSKVWKLLQTAESLWLSSFMIY